MLLCRSPRTVVSIMRHARSVVNHIDDALRGADSQGRYPAGFDQVEGRFWPVLEDSLASAPGLLRTFLEMLPEDAKVDHWGTGPFLRHKQTALAALRTVVPMAKVGVHSALQERPFGMLDQVEPYLRANADPSFIQMDQMNWWTATPANGVSQDQFALMVRNFWSDEASLIARSGFYFSSAGTALCLRFLAECLDLGHLAKRVVVPWEKVPNLGILCYSNFPFDGKGITTPYLSYRLSVYPDINGQTVVIPQHLIPGFEPSSQDVFPAQDPLIRWPRLTTLDALEWQVEEAYPRKLFNRQTGLPIES